LWWLFLLCFVSYFVGNINFSVVFSRLVLKKDIRTMASGNPGAANMLRNFGFKWGAVILLLDAGKGAIAAALGYFLYMWTGAPDVYSSIALYACGLASVVGHVFPVFYRFKGGKGVATTMGVFFVANPLISFVVLLGSIVYLAIFEYSAICSFLFITIMAIGQGIMYTGVDNMSIAVYSLLAAFYFLSWYTHRANIFRMLIGRENTATLFKAYKRRQMRKQQERWLADMKNSSVE
jgi:glycerol-3-phosphate acyltransferase PlsY